MGIEVKKDVTRKSQNQKGKDKKGDMKVREVDKQMCAARCGAKQGHTSRAQYRKRYVV